MEISKQKLSFKIKLQLCNNGKGFGPGMRDILTLVDEYGSLTSAYRSMGISPSKGWKIIKLAEDELGVKLLTGQSGGAGGGRSVLTDEGRFILNAYNEVEAELSAIADKLLENYFQFK